MENQKSPKSNHPIRGFTHHLAYRTRYRLTPKHRDARTFSRIQDSMTKVPGVKKIELNERTGSVLVHHEETPEILPLLDTILDELGVELLEGLAAEEIGAVSGISLIANYIKSRLADANQSVSQRTGNYLDLKTLLPMLFLGAGLYQASQNRSWWKQVPAWALFYYAFDSYLKFHGTGTGYIQTSIPGNGQKNLLS